MQAAEFDIRHRKLRR